MVMCMPRDYIMNSHQFIFHLICIVYVNQDAVYTAAVRIAIAILHCNIEPFRTTFS